MKDWNIRDFLSSSQGSGVVFFRNSIQFGRIFRSSFVPCYEQDSGTSAA